MHNDGCIVSENRFLYALELWSFFPFAWLNFTICDYYIAIKRTLNTIRNAISKRPFLILLANLTALKAMLLLWILFVVLVLGLLYHFEFTAVDIYIRQIPQLFDANVAEHELMNRLKFIEHLCVRTSVDDIVWLFECSSVCVCVPFAMWPNNIWL